MYIRNKGIYVLIPQPTKLVDSVLKQSYWLFKSRVATSPSDWILSLNTSFKKFATGILSLQLSETIINIIIKNHVPTKSNATVQYDSYVQNIFSGPSEKYQAYQRLVNGKGVTIIPKKAWLFSFETMLMNIIDRLNCHVKMNQYLTFFHYLLSNSAVTYRLYHFHKRFWGLTYLTCCTNIVPVASLGK